MSIHALIPARSGSKGLPNKNIALLGNFPLIAYSIAQAKLLPYINDIIVTTDSLKIASMAKKYGANAPFLRPAEISKDDSLDIEFFKHYIQFLKDQKHKLPELIVFLRPTTPCRTTAIINRAIKYMLDDSKATGLRSMHKSAITPYKIFRNKKGFAQPFLEFNGESEFHNYPRQRFEDTFVPNGFVDVVRTKTITKTDMLYGNRMKIWETEETPDVDTKKILIRTTEEIQNKKYRHLLSYLRKKV